MTPDYDPTRRPRKYYEEDQEETIEEQQAKNLGTLAVIVGGFITLTVGLVIGGILLFDKYKHWLGL